MSKYYYQTQLVVNYSKYIVYINKNVYYNFSTSSFAPLKMVVYLLKYPERLKSCQDMLYFENTMHCSLMKNKYTSK